MGDRVIPEVMNLLERSGRVIVEVYYESIKREPKIRGINKCRFDERLQTKTKEFTRLPYTGLVFISVKKQSFFKK